MAKEWEDLTWEDFGIEWPKGPVVRPSLNPKESGSDKGLSTGSPYPKQKG